MLGCLAGRAVFVGEGRVVKPSRPAATALVAPTGGAMPAAYRPGMPYLIEAVLFLSPFALYALWLRLNPGRAVAAHLIALALLGLVIAIGGAVWYGLARGMDPKAAYVPPRVTADGIVPGHVEPSRRPGAWPPAPLPAPPPPHQGAQPR
ncbi:hypothetical protein J8J14_01325 [Roseomonas sp. SSH11]|uniref:Uncharacterized protein n=1 Tax=Pararoseomonas baculiformis TaxID=2820812 RepID=A0ABS4A8T0_9PROT|nr:hypothetical protein [Pararoseomonas baculiformis]MBP0443407.1 hypothetical protein [Pararoseomonas baculiformis]